MRIRAVCLKLDLHRTPRAPPAQFPLTLHAGVSDKTFLEHDTLMYVFVNRLQSLSFQAGSRCLDKLLLSPPQRHVARVDPHGGLV